MKFKRFLYWFYWTLTYLPLRLIYPTWVVNKKNFRKKGKVIFAVNHTSALDPFIFKSHQHNYSYVMAKDSLWKSNKFVRHIMDVVGAIPVNREEVAVSTIKEVLGVLNSNQPLLIFPEGTRKSSLEDTKALKNGMSMFAAKTNAIIVPAVFLRKPRPFVPNKIIVGEPIDISEFMENGKISKEKYELISDKVLDEMHKLQETKKKRKQKREAGAATA
ncbi:MAG: 1-acyl-sn-glycerol-3-phosphate acyltransferase [Clostridia bacterium]|nr:1-acyl-sn-glycerol-3-phosphate acyltransferase [Clostridia bacterium]